MNTKRILIVGGCGFVGQNLAVSLVEKGFSILILDNANYPTHLYKYKDIYFSKINLLDVGDVEQRIAGFSPILVVHLASWGMSGEGMLNPLCHKINVDGTQTLLDACLKFNIPKFVYTSSYNVVFGGEEIAGGDESMDYFPENRQVDEYSASKTRAEKIVLQANGKLCKNGTTRLLTSSLRPCAIYGEGEQRHLPRIVKHMDNGLFLVKIGSATVDWIHIENLVAVFLLLIDKLLVLKDSAVVPAGQAYFISDGTPIDNFDFLRPLCEARLRTYPSAVIPTWFMLVVSYTLERVYFVTKKLGMPLVPILTRAEVLKVGVTHYFSIEKARKELGYEPKISSQQGGERLAVYYTSEGRFTNADYFEIAHIGWYAIIFAGMSLLAICAFGSHSTLQSNVFISHVNWLALTIFRTQPILTYVFYAAVGAHLFEALTAVSLSRSIGCKNTAIAWGVQTLLLGYPSLKMLYARRKAFAERVSREPAVREDSRRNDDADTSITGSASVSENTSATVEVNETLLPSGGTSGEIKKGRGKK